MRERHRSLQRLLRVKAQLHQIDEAKLGEIQRRRILVEEEKRALLRMLGDVEKNDSFILGLACRHLIQSERREIDLAAEESAQKAQLLQRSAQKKTLEKIVKETAVSIAREDEKLQLLDIGESLAARASSSLP
ncbi:hypothetical protein CCR94_06030 [Rhodoblastus sphagnicola]|uniref:Flagellar FliJ protein n=1 Tax=Rhodoblastus sphagnicola TaxID=333368 RepID=A0A2S6NCL1_9HYPH|nr:hypothetical protein [Rhodoblastus sphagnicola]MBB4199390.1 hypothetical protein [Rhodoblastus sphagnicola]PPQ32365.1 hypothetical protein CCR94_06030 [Rhodoblastus sphagnicola]